MFREGFREGAGGSRTGATGGEGEEVSKVAVFGEVVWLSGGVGDWRDWGFEEAEARLVIMGEECFGGIIAKEGSAVVATVVISDPDLVFEGSTRSSILTSASAGRAEG